MPAILICGDTLRSPELRHEVPLGIGDPFLYLETDGRRAVVTNVLEVDRIAEAAPRARAPARRAARPRRADRPRALVRADRSRAVRPRRAGARDRRGRGAARLPARGGRPAARRGHRAAPDDELFVERRRRKTDAELAGIRRAAHAAVAGWTSAPACCARPRSTATGCATRRGADLRDRCAGASARCARASARRRPTTSSSRRCAPATPSVTRPAAGRCPRTPRSASTCGRRTRPRAAGRT